MDAGGLEAQRRLILDAADTAGLGVVLASLFPPRILYASPGASAIFGASAAELSDRSPFDFVVPEQRDAVFDRLRRRLEGEVLPAVELTILRPSGSRITVECRIVDGLVVDARPAAVIFLTTAQVTFPADLAADAWYRALVDAAPDGIAITRGPRFLYANQAALALAGCATFEEMSRISLSDLLSLEDLRVFAERTSAMTGDGARFPRRDYRIRRGGKVRVVEAASMVIDFEGAPAILAFLRDVTDTRVAQDELERTQRLAALGTLVAGVAHEINNPLGYATIGVGLLRRFLDDGCRDLEGGAAALASVTSGLERIGSIVRDFRTFSRAEAPARVPTELAEVLASSLRMVAPLLRPRAGLDVDVGSLPIVQSGPGRLEQVFVNVLVNAVQAFDRDDVTQNVVRVRSACVGDEVTVTVADNGRGISPDHLPRIFDPFFTTKSGGEGTGLGLSICHSIVTELGGRIQVASTEGEGTTVTVVLRSDS